MPTAYVTVAAAVRHRTPEGGWTRPEAAANFLAWFAELHARCQGTRWELDTSWWEAGVLLHTPVPDDLTLVDAYALVREASRLLKGPGDVVGKAQLQVPWADGG